MRPDPTGLPPLLERPWLMSAAGTVGESPAGGPAQPAIVPQIVQKRAPEGSGAPQPAHLPAGAGGRGSRLGLGRSRRLRAASCGVGAAGGGGRGGLPGGAASRSRGAKSAVPAPGGGATSDAPHDGQTTHAGSSTILRQVWQRFGENGSTCPQ